ncbi:SubName: Full=Uncharacterized protein {ECO:0000313/EMBL:CCA69591.1} [Serendipita indica DSM 11827]|uniref:Uncharacterized protein n=1 Tax=Serendipita indica (strain DSM 11827) TaxID=1109443 RepID=G4TE37_SERID|nr:SubName: Full=Uncharacterized protein {ECO:0000313/EMBL:CCA69591.1} [Serendipita indica DSM 11827]CCA69591.1 hypothetical protein PIIN_03530 [Serendipita indica DSM 11827]
MTRRPAPTPLKLHPGPTPPRNYPKFTMPAKPQQSFYPSATPCVPYLRQEVKYFRRRGHGRSSSSSSVSSVDLDDASPSPGTVTPPTMAMTARTSGIDVASAVSARIMADMTRGPRTSSETRGALSMQQFRAQQPARMGAVRSIDMMGPWEHSKLRLSEAEIAAMISAPLPVVANPCPISW